MPSDDTYVKYGNSRSLFLWGGTYSMSWTQYMLRTTTSIVMMLIGATLFFSVGQPAVAVLILLLGIGMTYFWWRIGREGTGA